MPTAAEGLFDEGDGVYGYRGEQVANNPDIVRQA